MKYIIRPFLLIVILPYIASAQVGYSDAGAHANSMGNASVTFEDVYSVQNNQATLAFVENASAGISTQNFYLIEGGLNAHYAVAALPTNKAGVFGLSANYAGDNTFNQTKIGLAYGRKLAENVGIGVQLDYVGTKTETVGTGAAFTFDIGLLYKPVKNLSIGAKVFNPIRAKTGMDYEEEIPSIINVGIAYMPSTKVTICIEGEQNIQDDIRFKAGAEYNIIEQLYLRGGYLSNPSMLTAGLGIKIKSLNLDFSSQFHQQLGLIPGVGISYKF